MSDVCVPGQEVEVVNDPGVELGGRLLSVAEIQRAFRDLLSDRPERTQPTPAVTEVPHTSRATHEATREAVEIGPRLSPHTSCESVDSRPPSPHKSPGREDSSRIGGGRLDRDWIVVLAAHGGAGASCAALAVADALSAAGRPCHLIETAAPTRSGLVAAASVELGLDASGAWRRGARGSATLYRRADDTAPPGWPEQPSAQPVTTVIDAGLPSPANLQRIAEDEPAVVVTCRSTIPGVRMAEQMLAAVGDASTVVIAIGGSRWPGDVNASVGPRLRRLKDSDRVIGMPVDRRLALTGLTNSPLSKSVTAAGRTVLWLIDDTRSGEVAPTTRSASRRKEPSR